MNEETLQTPSAQNDATRGTVIVVPAGTPAAPAIFGQTLRLSAGTWFIHCARLVLGAFGLEPAAAPNALDPTWPVLLLVQNGRGVATWWETLPAAARGTFLVRANDASQCAIAIGGAGIVVEQRVLLVARQIIAPVMPAQAQTLALADGGGKATHAVPVGATLARYIGPACTGIDWVDVNGVSLAVDGALGTVRDTRVPLTAAAAIVNGIGAGASTLFTWEVWG